MSDLHTSARPDGTGDGQSPEAGSHLTLSPTGPQRPEAGSPLDRVLRRQSTSTRALLGFVPAQVR